MVLKQNAMELIAPGLRDDRDGRAARHPLFRIEIIGGDVDFLNGFGRRDIHGVVRQPDEYVRGAIDTGIVIVAIRAVDIRSEGPLWRVGNGILKLSRGRARNQVDQCLKIPVLIQRHVQNGL